MIFNTFLPLIACIASLSTTTVADLTLHIKEDPRNDLTPTDIHAKVVDELSRYLASQDCLNDYVNLMSNSFATDWVTAFGELMVDTSTNICTLEGTSATCDFSGTNASNEYKSGCEAAGGSFKTFSISATNDAGSFTWKGYPYCFPSSCSADDVNDLASWPGYSGVTIEEETSVAYSMKQHQASMAVVLLCSFGIAFSMI